MVTAAKPMTLIDAPFLPDLAEAVAPDDPAHAEIIQFLHHEALLLDRNRLEAWLSLMADDLVYRMPVRLTQDRGVSDGFSVTTGHFDDNYASMAGRVHRFVNADAVWAENPPSRFRRLVTNVTVYRSDVPEEHLVSSYVLLVRSRFNMADTDMISAERQDLIRRTSDGLRLARREIYVDQSTLGIQNLAAFL